MLQAASTNQRVLFAIPVELSPLNPDHLGSGRSQLSLGDSCGPFPLPHSHGLQPAGSEPAAHTLYSRGRQTLSVEGQTQIFGAIKVDLP